MVFSLSLFPSMWWGRHKNTRNEDLQNPTIKVLQFGEINFKWRIRRTELRPYTDSSPPQSIFPCSRNGSQLSVTHWKSSSLAWHPRSIKAPAGPFICFPGRRATLRWRVLYRSEFPPCKEPSVPIKGTICLGPHFLIHQYLLNWASTMCQELRSGLGV